MKVRKEKGLRSLNNERKQLKQKNHCHIVGIVPS